MCSLILLIFFFAIMIVIVKSQVIFRNYDHKCFPIFQIPGVVEFSMCLFFNKLVAYSFLYWLPNFIKIKSPNLTSQEAAYISTFFDLGGLFGGILLGYISDRLKERSLVTAISIIIALPFMLLYNYFGCHLIPGIFLLFFTGLTVTGPYALITTAITADLGTHEVLRSNSRALSTVSAIIDGTGSLGAAVGVIVCFELEYNQVFYALVASNSIALLFLTRLLVKSFQHHRDLMNSYRESEES